MRLNISINSACNNNCDYCFQKNSYHKLDAMLDFEEIAYILKWAHGVEEIGILGGEPTLHPQCVDICNMISQNYNILFFTNLLCDRTKLEKLVKIPNMIWLINTTTNSALQELFDENMEFINFSKAEPRAFGITLTGDIKHDYGYIQNLVRLGKKYPKIVKNYRVAFASPCHDKIFKLKNFDKSISYFYKHSFEYTPYIPIGFDCSFNSCFVSDSVYLRIIQDRRTIRVTPICMPEGFDIMADRSVNYCSSCPDELFNVSDYRQFSTCSECWQYILDIVRDFVYKYGLFYCKTSKFCTSKTCQGACFAALANLALQDKSKSEFIQNFKKKLSLKLSKRL